jgi:hypothetical protein
MGFDFFHTTTPATINTPPAITRAVPNVLAAVTIVNVTFVGELGVETRRSTPHPFGVFRLKLPLVPFSKTNGSW